MLVSTLGTLHHTQNAIGVGAVVTPQMVGAEYSLREKNLRIGYDWTSRGSDIDGRQRANICAPGEAINYVYPIRLSACYSQSAHKWKATGDAERGNHCKRPTSLVGQKRRRTEYDAVSAARVRVAKMKRTNTKCRSSPSTKEAAQINEIRQIARQKQRDSE